VVEFRSASKSFGNQVVFAELSLAVDCGQVMCLVGPSGCGKTTVLLTAAGLLEPDLAGQVVWERDGQVADRPEYPVAAVFQDQGLMPWRSAWGNVALPLEVAGVGRNVVPARVSSALSDVGLEDPASHTKYPHELSGGMRTRVALARALTVESSLMLLDEPLAHLDTFSRGELLNLLLDLLNRQHAAVIYVTHDLEEAALLGDSVLIMRDPPDGDYSQLPVPWNRPERSVDLLEERDFREFVRALKCAFSPDGNEN